MKLAKIRISEYILDMEKNTKLYYPFSYTHHYAYVVAFYGGRNPIVVKGPLVMKTYYKDDSKKEIDIRHTSAYFMDELFYETNKVIRESMNDSYNGKRELIELSLPELGSEYRIIYNSAEERSDRYDDQLSVLTNRDTNARGVAIILKRNDTGIHYLDEAEARKICAYYTND